MHELVALWLRYARINKANAIIRDRAGDTFGARLSVARGEVREQAADLLRHAADPLDAAALMHRQA